MISTAPFSLHAKMKLGFKRKSSLGHSLMVQQVKDLALPQLRCRSRLQCEFDSWPRHITQAIGTPKKKKRKKVVCIHILHFLNGLSSTNRIRILFFLHKDYSQNLQLH